MSLFDDGLRRSDSVWVYWTTLLLDGTVDLTAVQSFKNLLGYHSVAYLNSILAGQTSLLQDWMLRLYSEKTHSLTSLPAIRYNMAAAQAYGYQIWS